MMKPFLGLHFVSGTKSTCDTSCLLPKEGRNVLAVCYLLLGRPDRPGKGQELDALSQALKYLLVPREVVGLHPDLATRGTSLRLDGAQWCKVHHCSIRMRGCSSWFFFSQHREIFPGFCTGWEGFGPRLSGLSLQVVRGCYGTAVRITGGKTHASPIDGPCHR